MTQSMRIWLLEHLALLYLAVVNAAAFLIYGIDKWKARHGKRRISEAALLWMAAAGGSIGAWMGMKTWHHKTQHKKFCYGVPLIMLAQTALVVWCMVKG